MAFIKSQILVRDGNGNIVSGSAAIIDTKYGDFGSYHAKHIVRERLGKKYSGSVVTRKTAFFFRQPED